MLPLPGASEPGAEDVHVWKSWLAAGTGMGDPEKPSPSFLEDELPGTQAWRGLPWQPRMPTSGGAHSLASHCLHHIQMIAPSYFSS